jgi:hypothetical protein
MGLVPGATEGRRASPCKTLMRYKRSRCAPAEADVPPSPGKPLFLGPLDGTGSCPSAVDAKSSGTGTEVCMMPCMQSRQLAELWIFDVPTSGFPSNANDKCLEASLEVGPVHLAECTGWSGSGPS